ncbi:Hsp20/alpha crystallin family protein [Roseateles sp. SL47]|uniref:Hsp20/alpha crystallin family protein n=1 Tax=Roseateles sp. SL47 TaxID=2995138 RepID=UPI00226DDDCB|nr:Hsp20/alpha crystallin family protein [Roseateles sp. SL47]WAC73395.1 Hsp20/alpha crystallin family protein [Roseateles sp. SL47]
MSTQAVQAPSTVHPAVAAQVPPTAAGSAATRPASQASSRQRDDLALVPPVDVIEDAQGITLYADLPGVPRELLNLRVDGDQLIIEAEMRLDMPEGLRAGHAEVTRQHYRRAFTLSKELDAEQIRAELTNGVLQVRLPKAAHAQPRKIQVSLN